MVTFPYYAKRWQKRTTHARLLNCLRQTNDPAVRLTCERAVSCLFVNEHYEEFATEAFKTVFFTHFRSTLGSGKVFALTPSDPF